MNFKLDMSMADADFIVLIGTIFLLTINMCHRGRTITHLQISRFHTQVWYNYYNTTLKT